MNKLQIKDYYETFERFQREEVSYSYWLAFCEVLLEEIMEENKDVFLRLKDR